MIRALLLCVIVPFAGVFIADHIIPAIVAAQIEDAR